MDSEKAFDGEGAFLQLVEENGGFEFCIGLRDWEDHLIGGKGGKVWYLVAKDQKPQRYWLGVLENGEWSDEVYEKKGGKFVGRRVDPGTTISKVVECAYLGKDRIDSRKSKPREIEKDGHPCYHYDFGFGEVAYDVSTQFGITTAYSNINDVDAGYHLRDILTGNDVEPPAEG